MIGGLYYRYVRVEPPLAQCTSTDCYSVHYLLTSRVCMFRVTSGTPVLEYMLYIILSSPPLDGPPSLVGYQVQSPREPPYVGHTVGRLHRTAEASHGTAYLPHCCHGLELQEVLFRPLRFLMTKC